MSLFKKKETKSYDPFEIIFEDEIPAVTPKAPHSPNALTTEEIVGFNKDTPINNVSTGALDALKKRLSNANLENGLPPEAETEPKTSEINESPVLKEEVPTQNITEPEINISEPPIKEKTEKQKTPTLLDKCKPYLVDKDGKDTLPDPEPLYQLESVAEILKADSEKLIEKLYQNYEIDIEVDSLGKISLENAVEETSEIKENDIPIVSEETKTEPQNPIKIISDIDYTDIPDVKPASISFEPDATITFTPVSSGDNSDSTIKVSTHTRSIDLTNELVKIPAEPTAPVDDELHLEEDDFEEFIPKTEFSSPEDIKTLRRKFFITKKNAFLVTVFTFFITAILAFAKLPFISNILLTHTAVSMIVCSSLAGIAILLNMDMFLSFAKIFNKNSTPDISISLASIFTTAYAIVGILKSEIILDILILLGFMLSIRSLSKFFKASYMLGNFMQICTSSQKKAVKLINDPAITFSMAKNSIEGDVLIAAAQKTEQIADFMKYSTYGSFFWGRLPVITIVSLIISLISAVSGAAYFDDIFYGIYAATAIQLLTALPSVFLIDNLPLYRASKKLNKLGSMIMGKIGAEHLEMANAVVLSSNDLFPNGTVTLHQMKVLSENMLDDTLVRAAALTEYMSSTLAPIFKEIATSGNVEVLPDTDTVKYEDRMGISGWVDNKLLFIGNRALMEAHGIEVPNLEIDRKILRQGFFPVYVATGEKACALLMIQYSIERKIANELRNLSKIGVTLLINNTDPNLTEDMICDYFGLYDDSVKVMSAAGCHMYKNTVAPIKSTSAPASYKGSSLALAAIINSANRIKRSNTLLNVVYILSAVFGILVFTYTSFSGSGSLISGAMLLIYGLASIVISYLLYLTERP